MQDFLPSIDHHRNLSMNSEQERAKKAIFDFLDGYIASAIIHKVLLDDEEKFRNQFDEWVRIKLIEQTGIQLDLHRSCYHYISTVYTDEQERIDSFFRLVHEFTESMNIVLKQNYR